MIEQDIIRVFAESAKRSPQQANQPFGSDAELVTIGGLLWGITVDGFTPEEDLFTSDDPHSLGSNLAVATLSDLLAVGAKPAWFLHDVSLPKSVDQSFVAGLAHGISSVLDEAGCILCGGDVGCSETWRYTGVAMGPIPNNKPLTRILPQEPQTLWVTGCLGDANLAAFTAGPTPRFELRLAESEAIRDSATACIDTSGGFFDSIWTLHILNPELGFEVDLDVLPLACGIREAAKAGGFPPEGALLGGAGEYELLFALPAGSHEAAERMCGLGATGVGSVRPDAEPGIRLRCGESTRAMTEPPPDPREAATVRDHINEVMQMAVKLFA